MIDEKAMAAGVRCFNKHDHPSQPIETRLARAFLAYEAAKPAPAGAVAVKALRMLVDRDWLREKIAADPDCDECEARSALAHPAPAPAVEPVAWIDRSALPLPKDTRDSSHMAVVYASKGDGFGSERRPLYTHPAPADPRPEQVEAVAATGDVLAYPWACKAWGDGTSSPECTNVICPDCEVVIASDLPIEIAVHIAGLHNTTLAAPAPATAPAPAAEMIAPPVTDEMLRAARDTLPGGFTDICDADLEDIWEAMHRAALAAPARAKVEARS